MTKTYDKYKDSGIAWIGEIPSEWVVVPHKRVMRKVKEIQEHYQGEDIISLTMNGVIIRDLEAGGKMPTTFDGYQKVYPGNLLQCLFDIDVTPRCVGLIKNEGLSSPAYSQFTMLNESNASYYDYLLRYMDDNKALLHLSKNLRSSLTESDFGQIPTICPSSDEQELIASYLDEKCQEIDSLISLQEEMIIELQAYIKSIISEVVTKGIDSNVSFKESGVDWIEKIPQGWDVRPLKSLFYTEKGLNITKENLVEIGIPVLSYGQIHSKENPRTQLNESLFKFVPESYLTTNPGCLVQPGCFLIADTSEDREGCGNAIYVDRDLTLFAGYHTIVARPFVEGNYKYLAYLFMTDYWRQQIRSKVTGIKVFSVNQKHIRATSVILPPKEEQLKIVEYLDEKVQQINKVISLKQEKILELKDYKKSIIFEYVTGKKRV